MTRLTEKLAGKYYSKRTILDVAPIIDKLGQLEDFEEKHNIDLLKTLSILDNGIWILYEEGKIINVKPTLRLINNSYWLEYDYFIYKPEDYGIFWALTKEELQYE